MQIQYKQVVNWDISLIDVAFLGSEQSVPLALKGLAISAVKTTTGAPATPTMQWAPSAQVYNTFDATWYRMTGTTASPAWTLVSGSGSGITALTGDVTASGTGSVAATIAAGAVTLAKLASGVSPAYVSKFGGKITWSGSGASLATTVTGVAATDIVIATIQTAPTQAAYIVSVAPTTNTITITLSAANTSNNAVISYQVFRAAA